MYDVIFRPIFFIIAFFVISKPVLSSELRTVYFESHPRFMQIDGKWSGVCNDIYVEMNKRLRNLSIRIPKYFTPLKRITQKTKTSHFDLLGCIDREILDDLDFDVFEVPLYDVSSVLIMSEKKRYRKLEELNSKKIGVIRGSRANNELKKHLKSKSIQEIGTLQSLVYMLQKKRVDGIYDDNLSLFYVLNQRKLLLKYRSILKTNRYAHYLGVSKTVPKKEKAELIRVLKLLYKTGVLEEIYWKYLGR